MRRSRSKDLMSFSSSSSSSSVSSSGGSTSGTETHSSAVEQPAVQAGLPFEKVRNFRDIATACPGLLKPGRLYRTGFPSESTPSDLKLWSAIDISTLIDLRSPKELGMDTLMHSPVYAPYETVDLNQESSGSWRQAVLSTEVETTAEDFTPTKQRFLLSLIDERKYVSGLVLQAEIIDKAWLVALIGASAVSRRARAHATEVLLERIKAGGLPLLNEMLLLQGGPQIARALKLIADADRHPVALYCTAGKDRTGLVAALALSAAGVDDAAIVADYAKSDAAYAQLEDKRAMVAALDQHDLDSEKFLRAPPEVMVATLAGLRARHGGVDAYLDGIGFDAAWRARLRAALTQ
ncbi:protein-tyrosine phosphatase-like protein [Tribonema minus]|uniref:Protein-tyrosine phosphatase-like protein n=1 Tax=Tribonema minus TaxID=303371 RepID=A0A836CH30_9STRA|nr:protein-tyrosine phosphatase-like protein [Tribonema minus]